MNLTAVYVVIAGFNIYGIIAFIKRVLYIFVFSNCTESITPCDSFIFSYFYSSNESLSLMYLWWHKFHISVVFKNPERVIVFMKNVTLEIMFWSVFYMLNRCVCWLSVHKTAKYKISQDNNLNVLYELFHNYFISSK